MKLAVALVIAPLVLVVPAAAPAATVTSSGGTIEFLATPGESNDVLAERVPGAIRVRDAGAPVQAFGECYPDGAAAICPTPGSSSHATIHLGDGHDELVWRIAFATAYGGPGDDQISATGPVDGGPGADVMDVHTASYASRTAGVEVTLDGIANDGEPGEGDNVKPGATGIHGGEGPDALSAVDDRGNRVFLDGNGGHDRLVGGPGPDGVWGGDGDDFLDGGAGRDFIQGDAGADELHGGGPHDADQVDGGPGSDRVHVGSHGSVGLKDGEFDEVTCGPPGVAQLGLDHFDRAIGCTYAYLRFSPVARVYTSSSGLVRVGVECASSVGRPCHGAVRLRPAGTRTPLASGPFHLEHGERAVVELKLRAAGRALQRRQRRVSAEVVAVHQQPSDPPTADNLDRRRVRWVTR